MKGKDMKIGIVIHSRTGNTLGAARKIAAGLEEAGHSVSLGQIKADGDEAQAVFPVQLQYEPDITPYDLLVFGAPVHGFSLSAVMKTYLSHLKTLKSQKVVCFVTHYFPYRWMGGMQAVGQMKSLCTEKEGTVFVCEIMNRTEKDREAKIRSILEKTASV